MTNNDLFYVCSLIEYMARRTNNRRGVIVQALGIDGIKKQLHDASVNHCLTFEQVSAEVIGQYGIGEGCFNPSAESRYSIPKYTDIGKLYATIIQHLSNESDFAQSIFEVFSSPISDEISDFRTDLYYQNPDYLVCSYREGKLL